MGAVKLAWRSDILNKAGLGPGIDTLYITYVENARSTGSQTKGNH